MSLERWGLCSESTETGELCGLSIDHKGRHVLRLSEAEQGLVDATRNWTAPTVVRTYSRDKLGEALLAWELESLTGHGYQLVTQTEDGGHVHAGRLILTGGLSVFAGGRGVRSKGSIKMVFQLVPATQPTPGIGAAADPAAALEALASLRDRGLITPDEYDAKRAEVLARL